MDTKQTPSNEDVSVLCLADFRRRPEDAEMEKWFDRAKNAMASKGITQTALADHFGMTRAGMGKWLSGQRDPRLEDLIRIADFIGMPRAELLLGSEEPTHVHGFPDYAAEPLQLMMDGARSGRLDAHWFKCLAMAARVLDEARNQEGENSSFGAYLAASEPALSPDALHLAREYDKVTDESQRKMVFAQTEHLLRLLGRPGGSKDAGTKDGPSRRTN